MPATPADAPAAADARAAPEPLGARDLLPVLFMGLLFVVSMALAVAIAPTFAAEDLRAFEDPESLVNPLIYLGIVVAFTVLILVIARLGRRKLIQYIILGAVFLTMVYVFWPLLGRAFDALGLAGAAGWALALGVAAAVALTAALYYYPEWWVVDSAGVVVSAGAAAIFGISFGLLPSLLLLVGFAVYDAIAVYRTKHMIDLADSVLELRLPIMFVVPKDRGYSFLKEKGLKARPEGEPREAMFMGLGDVVIPTVLVVSSLMFLDASAASGFAGLSAPAVVALATTLGTLVGYCVLMAFVLRGNPQAGLPSLNGGAIVGFFAALLPLYGLGPLTAALCPWLGC